ncbi:MAG: hypothetical protein ACYSWO_09575 [Planctomycetota bacterium]|jgi:hypothetical protein
MNISVEYQLIGCSRQYRFNIAPEDYFDPIEKGENYWDHGVDKKFFLHEYLNIDPDQVKWIVACESRGTQRRIRRVQYLDGDRATMEHVVDEHGEERIILGAFVDCEESHIIHLLKKPGRAWSVVHNSLGSEAITDGEYESKDLCKQWTYEELEEFGTIGNDAG